MDIIFGWIIFSLVVGFIGRTRKIGFFGAFFLSLLLSPILGLIITLTSKNLEDEAFKNDLLNTIKRQNDELNKNFGFRETYSYNDRKIEELRELKRMRDKALITESEYQFKKDELNL